MSRPVRTLGKLSWAKRACPAFALCAATAMALSAQTFTTLHWFHGPDGGKPSASLIQGTDGNLYGTTANGGANGDYGTVFKISPSGTLTTLYSFCPSLPCTDGADPAGSLLQATDGNLYGTTVEGGAYGGGEIFKITMSGTLTTLYSFCSGECLDGGGLYAGLVQAPNGDFYGTTWSGGASLCQFSFGPYPCGTIFKITPSGTLTTLHNFDGTDGALPEAGLIQATDGNFYGTTEYGGSGCVPDGCGTVFEITPSGALTTLHSFDGTDGENPSAGLVQTTDGDFYGTTVYGGARNAGTLFKIGPYGSLTTLYSFCAQSGCTDGATPFAGLIRAARGELYGTTYNGGAANAGTVFTMTPTGTLTTLHSFCGLSEDCAGGAAKPGAGLVQATDGDFYGASALGGFGSQHLCVPDLGCGSVFRLSVGVGPFVEPQTTLGQVGAAVNVLGTGLTGATSVSFNGTPAVFAVKSASEITTTVPAGATTGKIEVVTPSGTLSSNVPFRVIQ